jgi:xylose isomerase
MSNLNMVHGVAQALWAGKLFHIDLNGQHGPKFDQDLVFGHGDLINAFSLVDLLETAGYEGPRHFDFKPPRTEDISGVWESAAGCMRNYLIFKERSASFRADPEVQEALKAARVGELSVPTFTPGESLEDFRKEEFDPEAAALRGFHFERLDQLAMDHLLGVR